MALDFRQMTFATVISLHLQRDFAIAYKSPYIWTASVPMYEYPRKQPLLLPPPPNYLDGKDTKTTRVRNPREPRKYDLVIFNTERMPPEYISGMPQRVFHEEARAAHMKSFFYRHIHEGPYTHEVAQTKAQEVRQDAFEHSAPIPQLRYALHKN